MPYLDPPKESWADLGFPWVCHGTSGAFDSVNHPLGQGKQILELLLTCFRDKDSYYNGVNLCIYII